MREQARSGDDVMRKRLRIDGCPDMKGALDEYDGKT